MSSTPPTPRASPGSVSMRPGAMRKIAPAAPHAQHMPSHIFVRLGLWNETITSNWRSYQAGHDYAKAMGLAGTMEEFHALDYAVYGYLQRGQDSAARATVAKAMRTKPSLRGLVSDYNRTAMAARVPLERGDWVEAAELRAPAESLGPVASALLRFTHAIGSARSGRADAAGPEVKALDSIATALEQKGEPYWSRVVRIKHDAAEAWVRWAEGDTTGALALARAAADSEEVTDKHQVTPGELLPARELEGDMLLLAGRYAEARAAYEATLARERQPGPEPFRQGASGGAGRRPRGCGHRLPGLSQVDGQLRWESSGAGHREGVLGLLTRRVGLRFSSLLALAPHPSPATRRRPGHWPGTGRHLLPW